MANNQITGLFNYDNNTGLRVSSRKEVFNDLVTLTQVAYGQDFSIEEGNSWYSFLDLIAGSMVTLGNVTQKVYNALSAESTGGAELDNVVSVFGLVRKVKTASHVTVKITINKNSSITLPLYMQEKTVYLKDSNGNIWVNNEAIYIYPYKFNPDGSENLDSPNNVGSVSFEATGQVMSYGSSGEEIISPTISKDPTQIFLGAFNNGTSDFEGINGGLIAVGDNAEAFNTLVGPDDNQQASAFFVNELNSVTGWGDETDAQLRARWAKGMFSKSVGTVEGLEAQIINNTDVGYVKVFENTGNSQTSGIKIDIPEGIPEHSIWVVVDGKSTWDGTGYSQNPSDMEIANNILRYKSIGCGVGFSTGATGYDADTGTGQIQVKLTYRSEEYVISFSRASAQNTHVSVTLSYNSSVQDIYPDVQQAISENIRVNLKNTINSLGMHKSVTNAILISAIQSALTGRNLPTVNVEIGDGAVDVSYDQYANLDVNYQSTETTEPNPYVDGVQIIWQDTKNQTT